MLDLLQENEKFRSHAKAIVDNRQRTIECSKRSDTFDLFYAIEYCAALLVLRKEVQAKQAFSDFMRRAQSLFIKNRQRIFEESLDFEQRDVRSITYLCHLIDMSGFVALLTQNNEWIDAIDECLVEGEFGYLISWCRIGVNQQSNWKTEGFIPIPCRLQTMFLATLRRSPCKC
ncbi:MAG: hypothetical protein P8166_18570 [Candidatus Thiodiazotropha sp.]